MVSDIEPGPESRLPPHDPAGRPRILVIQYNGYGDVLMMVPVFRLLRARIPSAHVTVLAGSTDTAALLQGAGLVDAAALLPVTLSRLEKLAAFWRLRRHRFDIAISATGMGWQFAVAARWGAGIPKVVSDSDHPLARLAATTVREAPRAHRVMNNGALLRPILGTLADDDIRAVESRIGFGEPSTVADSILARLRTARGPVIALHLGSASQPIKRLPAGLAVETLRELRRQAPDATVLYLQGPPDPPHAGLPAELREGTLALAGLATTDLLHVLRACSSVLTGDTGIAHLAAAAGTKVVVAAGPTDIERTRPWGARHVVVTSAVPHTCRPCYATPVYDDDACPRGRSCLSTIRPTDLAAALLGGAGKTSR